MGSSSQALNRKFAMLAAGVMAVGTAGMTVSGSPDSSFAMSSLEAIGRPFAPMPMRSRKAAVPSFAQRAVNPEQSEAALPMDGSSASPAQEGSSVGVYHGSLPPLASSRAATATTSGALSTVSPAAPPAPAAPAPVAEGKRVHLYAEPAIGVENRPSSPMPFAGDTLDPEPVALVPQPETAAPQPKREIHTLTSFDGNRTMTSGEMPPRWDPLPENDPPPPHHYQAPPPVVWNNPIHWISTHHGW